MKTFLSIAFVLVLYCSCSDAKDRAFLTEAPIIGILTQPNTDNDNFSTIAQSYVGWLEMAGARSTAVHWDDDRENLLRQLGKINGLLFQGGSVTIWNETSEQFSPYDETLCWLVEQVLEMNFKGDYFPIWATCHGLQSLLSCITEDPASLLEQVYDIHQNRNLDFTEYTNKYSIFGNPESQIYNNFQTKPILHFTHMWGVKIPRFESEEKLTDFFYTISTAKSTDDFIATVIAKNYPIIGVQFHAEKAPFEWHPSKNFTHSYEAIQASWQLANYFVNMTRQNGHKYESQQQAYENLIYRNTSVDGQPYGYEQVYIFPFKNKMWTLKDKLSKYKVH